MIHHFACPHSVFSEYRFVFDWDDTTGEISGRDAASVLKSFEEGYVPAHPIPADHILTSTKSKTDIAAIIGYSYILPPELEGYYPEINYNFDDGVLY